MQGYAWLYLIAYPIDYIIYAYNYIYGFSLFADVSLSGNLRVARSVLAGMESNVLVSSFVKPACKC